MSKSKKTKTSLKSLVDQYDKLNLEITFAQEALALILREFGGRDGQEPKNIVITQKGQPVPTEYVYNFVREVHELILSNKIDSLESIKEIKVDY
tara:strand:+ start:262 stop:543 length:282 start_codon:yes stop_codon:yes gene_type:complete